jgi:hypothetical protein
MSQPVDNVTTRDKIPRAYWEYTRKYEKNSSGKFVLKVCRETFPTAELTIFRGYSVPLVAYKQKWRISQPYFDVSPSSWAVDVAGKSAAQKAYLDINIHSFLESWVGLQTTVCFPGTSRGTPLVNGYELVEAGKHRLHFEIRASVFDINDHARAELQKQLGLWQQGSPEDKWNYVILNFLERLEAIMRVHVHGFTWRNNCDVYTACFINANNPSSDSLSFHVVCPFLYVTRVQNEHIAQTIASDNTIRTALHCFVSMSISVDIYKESQAIRLLGTSDRHDIVDQGLPHFDYYLRRKRLGYQCTLTSDVLASNSVYRSIVTSDYYKAIFQKNRMDIGIDLTELYFHNREIVKEICRFSLVGLCHVYQGCSRDLTEVNLGEKKKPKLGRPFKEHQSLTPAVNLELTPCSIPIPIEHSKEYTRINPSGDISSRFLGKFEESLFSHWVREFHNPVTVENRQEDIAQAIRSVLRSLIVDCGARYHDNCVIAVDVSTGFYKKQNSFICTKKWRRAYVSNDASGKETNFVAKYSISDFLCPARMLNSIPSTTPSYQQLKWDYEEYHPYIRSFVATPYWESDYAPKEGDFSLFLGFKFPCHEIFYERYPTSQSVIECTQYGPRIKFFLDYIRGGICGNYSRAYELFLWWIAHPFVSLKDPRTEKLFVLCGSSSEERAAFINFLLKLHAASACVVDYTEATSSKMLPPTMLGKTLAVLNNTHREDSGGTKKRQKNLHSLICERSLGIKDGDYYQNTLNFLVADDIDAPFSFDLEDERIVTMRSCYTQISRHGQLEFSSSPFKKENDGVNILHEKLADFFHGDTPTEMASLFMVYARRNYEESVRDIRQIRRAPKIHSDIDTDGKLFKHHLYTWLTDLLSIERPYLWRTENQPFLENVEHKHYFAEITQLHEEFKEWSKDKWHTRCFPSEKEFNKGILYFDPAYKNVSRFNYYRGNNRYESPGIQYFGLKERLTGYGFCCDNFIESMPRQ